jgi:UDP-glucose/iron transport system ATP-binding protein
VFWREGKLSEVNVLLRAQEIGRRAPNSDRWLLQDVSIDICPGERLAIVGPSGSGKSLLLRALALLDGIDAGKIEFRRQPAASTSVPDYRRNVSYLHQRPALFEGTVESNLQKPFSLKIHRNRRYDRERVLDLLRAVGREDSFLQKASIQLSGGEAQIAALIRAIQLEPSILLLDEPTAALDQETAAAAERLVNEWLKRAEDLRAMVLVSHDLSQAERMSNRRLEIRNGRLEGNSE